MSRIACRPYLITTDSEGAFRVTVRTTRMNSQNYPLVSSEQLDGSFPSLRLARAHIRETFRAEAADIETK
jgi:hypothetical protein